NWLGHLSFLQQFAHAQNTGQWIVEFVREPADHLSHRRQAFALNDLLFKLFLNRDVTDRDNDATQFAPGIEQWAGRGPHGTPASIPMACAVLAEPELFPTPAHIAK